ncbi:ditrans,polycis-undecaprenyl-diphosphate synthase [Psychromonas marina]|uniref:Ditrans,polycis-undecaprenyl-diphosphate synthase ((2E,6E)-farnesyl-diphosphate specific) n=2 Tax=Psychromonas marina TaxID=88364 RepID=A0ABQ6DXD2_9GAMM|nr:polyprenyl diphosphate synthase [Psychromonas marina]GLS89401.1 ditrans,polycis-undecaprenyl-diphosphate synthase [Psychromonas marina]
MTEQQILPKHVAIIMDGNGRWAESKGKHRVFGHKHGVKSLRKAISFAAEKKVQALTIYAFSSENWKRPEKEVNMLMELFFTVLGSEVKKLQKHNIKLKIIGDISAFSERLQKKVLQAEKDTENNSGLALNVAANYGGRWDITQATKQIATLVKQGDLAIDDITEERFHNTLTLGHLPAVDLMIRTGGDHRISNFLLWQMAYAELYFCDVLWPDFNADAFQDALDVFASKERRFGQTSEQVARR